MELPKQYNPKDKEIKLYEFWLEKNIFKATVNSSKKPYTIVIPPPNITGILTMGHVLNNTIQDILIRWKRMCGYEACWIPGTDHAGIATQNVVERELSKKHIYRKEIGREKFLEYVWQWKEKYGATIITQLKRLGCSCDWSRERFTLDKGLSDAVKEVFIRLYNEGLIYKGKYIVNWCPRCATALSDDEIEYNEHNSYLWYIKYPFYNSNDYIVVATTRPETMLGDTAIAVNPEDKRYKHLTDEKIVLPLVGRKLTIIKDELVDPEFGTGAVKVTPAHDPVDFQLSIKHNLEQIIIMDINAITNDNVPETYRGLDRYKCREKVIDDLKSQGFLVKIEPYTHAVGHCYRCNTVIEPYLSDQWFVKMKPLAEKALDVVLTKQIKFYPEKWIKIYQHWIENIRDWCISRQLWWGHRIPVYYCKKNGYSNCPPIVSRNQPDKCPNCGNTNIEQDPDVLDTWFSSWLWPFSTLGWPEETDDLKYFYPTDTLVTGPDIIFFWVARMIMAGMKFMNEVPFKNVYFTSMVRDLQGRKMSKSLGNSPDPLDLIDEYGADSLRFTISYLSPLGQDILFSKEKCEIGKKLCNKIWNASRFILMNIGDSQEHKFDLNELELETMDKWILMEYYITVKNVTDNLDKFEICEYTKTIYDFFWDKFCDWYLELVKPRLLSNNIKTIMSARFTLVKILVGCLKLFHPVIPFITEEIYQYFKSLIPEEKNNISIMLSNWEVYDNSFESIEAKNEIEFLINLIKEIRAIRTEFNVVPKSFIDIVVNTDDEKKKLIIDKYLSNLKFMTKVEKVLYEKSKPEYSAVIVIDNAEIYIPLKNIIDLEKEKLRLEKICSDIENQLNIVRKKLSNEQFIKNAPESEITRVKLIEKESVDKLVKLKKYIEMLKQ